MFSTDTIFCHPIFATQKKKKKLNVQTHYQHVTLAQITQLKKKKSEITNLYVQVLY